MDRKIHEYDGDTITVRYEPKICIHAAECVKGLPAVFNPQERRWIAPENAAVEEIAEVIGRCPSGALSYSQARGEESEGAETDVTAASSEAAKVADSPGAAVVVTTIPNGPVMLQGELRIMLPDGGVREQPKAALCRCGASSTKPFCDGQHREIGFEAE